jgi:Arc/MetJ-type ribon-helix-helix transcriptional regulator
VNEPTLTDVRPRMRESEKMAINLGVVDLGQIDLLVQEGFYSNRSDLIRTAVRNQLAVHADTRSQAVARRTLMPGLLAQVAIESVSVLGAFHASPAVREAPASRML